MVCAASAHVKQQCSLGAQQSIVLSHFIDTNGDKAHKSIDQPLRAAGLEVVRALLTWLERELAAGARVVTPRMRATRLDS